MIKWKYMDEEDSGDNDLVGTVLNKNVDVIHDETDNKWHVMYDNKWLVPKFKTREQAKQWCEDAEYNGTLTVSKQIRESFKDYLSEDASLLTDEEFIIVNLRNPKFGKQMSYEKIGKLIDFSTSRTAQLDAKAMNKIKHPGKKDN